MTEGVLQEDIVVVFIQLPTPKLEKNQMGQVNVSVTLTNNIDQILAERGFIPEADVRQIVIDNVLVDTGATLLCLPTKLIEQLGLPMHSETMVKTAAGEKQARIFKGADLSVAGRSSTFDCLELTEIEQPLLGVIPMERLGLEPDLRNERLKVLPDQSGMTYFYA